MAKLIFRSGIYAGKNMSLPTGKSIVLGRNRDVDLPLNDPKLSRRHCQLTATETGCLITDMGSTNGTFVNGNRLEAEKPQELIEFDRIILGDTEIELYLAESGEKALALSSDDNMPVIKLNSSKFKLQDIAPTSPTHALMQAVEDGGGAQKSGLSEAILEQEILQDPDPLLAAMYEMGLPLPPEPPQSGKFDTVKIEMVYCQYCGDKISLSDRSSGVARTINNKMACQKCLSRPRSKAPNSPVVDTMLEGLDQEPTVVDTSKRARINRVDLDAIEILRQQSNTPTPMPEPPRAPAQEKNPDKHKLFGDDFEEIG